MPYIITAVITLLVALPLGIFVGIAYRRRIAEAEIGSAEEQAKKILEDGIKAAETKKKEALIEAKEEILQAKNDFDREVKDRRNELSHQERRVTAKEESLDRKSDNLEKKEEQLAKKIRENEELNESIKKLAAKEEEKLQEISGMTAEQAKAELVEKLASEIRHEQAMKLAELETDFKDEAERRARDIISLAIQRCAADHVAETTVSVVPLPSEDMKGRIIGREGRNIRALEAATGVNILIDDTPEAVVISCFDPIRKEIARRLLEKLISDGRIHPTRIEELIKKIRKEIDEEVFDAGEKAVLDCGVQGVPKQIITLLGRLQFRFSFSQNVLKHSIETAAFMGTIAAELGLDEQKARRIGLFHDIGKAVDHEIEGTHAAIGADILRKHNEAKDVINAVAAHHEEVEGTSIYAVLANACDALSASRPGARSETTELYLKRLEQLENIANEFTGVESCFALQAGREIRVVVQPEKISEAQAQVLSRDICGRIEKEMNYPGQIKVTVIRETRSVDYAK